jgi:RecA-family ATPase
VSNEVEPLPVVRIAAIQAVPIAHRWLVQDLWADEAVGVIGGSPKSFKSWLALELSLAVASGRPALGRFAVRPGGSGHVLVYAAEDSAAAVRERVSGLAQARGVALDKLAMGLITVDSLRLDRPDHRDRLHATLAKIRPRLLVLDPLVRLHRADENSSAEISELLGWLRSWQREFHVAIMLVHHVRKSPTGQPGQSLRGSGDLHAWGDSNLYLLRDHGRLLLHAEHRSNPMPAPFAIELGGDPARLTATPTEASAPDRALVDRVLQALARQPLTRTELRDQLRVRNETLGAVLDELESAGRVLRADGRLAVPVPTLRDQRERNDPTA